MTSIKRITIATLCGILFGFVCMGLASSNPDPSATMTAAVKWNIVISRAMLGFMIGISALKWRWWIHGIGLGLISSIPMAVTVLDRPDIVIGTFIMGMIYGLLTELITSILLKAKRTF